MELAQDFGWTLTEIGELTLADVDLITSGWQQRPPLAAMVGAFMGVKRDDPPEPTGDTTREWTLEDVQAFVSAANRRD